MKDKKISLKEMRLGDVVRLVGNNFSESAFSHLVVVKKTEDEITFFRTYVSLGDFTHTGGVTPYVGIETFTAYSSQTHLSYELLDNIFRPSLSERIGEIRSPANKKDLDDRLENIHKSLCEIETLEKESLQKPTA